MKVGNALAFDIQITDCQSTAFFMQYLAQLAATSGSGKTIFNTGITFDVIPVFLGGKFGIASKYSSPFSTFTEYSNYMTNPHMQLSYYLLA